MINCELHLESPERFELAPELSTAKIEKAAEAAIRKLEETLPRFTHNFISEGYSANLKYNEGPNVGWTTGMHTGLYWLAYELTGNRKFYDAALVHIQSFKERLQKRIELNDHDVGFLYTPSCVAGYKVAELEEARNIAIAAAEVLYEKFSKRGGFIIRAGTGSDVGGNYNSHRTMVDTMMNIPLLLWAGVETGNGKYTDAAIIHYYTTMKYLIREDASTFHHYQFDPETHMPVRGVTNQGHSHGSCWSRGHAWCLSGFPIAYAYTKNEELIDVHKNLTYYFLNRLPSDGVPYWDLVFGEGSSEPRDSSAGAISICGLLEMCKYLPEDAPQKNVFKNAAAYMMNALIDNCADDTQDSDGLILHVTAARPQGIGIDNIALYGDYFYLESLVRYLKPDWKMYW